jgi:hypothetical protein
MLRDFTRSLFIDMRLQNGPELWEKALSISNEFGLRLESTEGSLERLIDTLKRAIEVSSHGKQFRSNTRNTHSPDP